jgi:hypothetical protein
VSDVEFPAAVEKRLYVFLDNVRFAFFPLAEKIENFSCLHELNAHTSVCILSWLDDPYPFFLTGLGRKSLKRFGIVSLKAEC